MTLLADGICCEHNRQYECFCNKCLTLICPTCLMFGEHKNHEVSEIPASTKLIKDDIFDYYTSGLFETKNFERVLMDIRYSKLKSEETRDKLITTISENFEKIIKAIKERESEVVKYIENEFEDVLAKLIKQEKKWEKYEYQASDVCAMIKKDKLDDNYICKHAKFIYEVIDNLKKNKSKVKIEYPDSLEFNFSIKRDKINVIFNVNEFINCLKEFVKPEKFIHLEYNC